MRLSVVTTLYRSAPFLREFHARVSAAAAKLTTEYEIILVNDGSPDDSLVLALELQQSDPRIRVIDLSRNFGHHQAMWTGLRFARGDWVFLIDSDLEEAPELLNQFAVEQDATGADVVFGVQERRPGGMAGWGGRVAYWLLRVMTDRRQPENVMTVRLMSRRYVDALLQHSEVTFTIAWLWTITGFEQVAVRVPKGRRDQPSYGLIRRYRMLVEMIVSTTHRPLEWIFYLGTIILISSTGVASWLVIRWLSGELLPGWTSLMVSMWLLAGLIIFCQGVVGIYLSRVFLEAKRRPLALVRHVYERSREGGANVSRPVGLIGQRPDLLQRQAG